MGSKHRRTKKRTNHSSASTRFTISRPDGTIERSNLVYPSSNDRNASIEIQRFNKVKNINWSTRCVRAQCTDSGSSSEGIERENIEIHPPPPIQPAGGDAGNIIMENNSRKLKDTKHVEHQKHHHAPKESASWTTLYKRCSMTFAMKHQKAAKYLQEVSWTYGFLLLMAKQVLDYSLLHVQYADHLLQVQKNCKSTKFKASKGIALLSNK